MNTISLKYRIAITIFVLEAVMLALVLWQTLGISYETERNQLTNAENMTLNLLGDLARTARITSEYPQLQARIENLQRDRNIKEIIVADAGKRIVVSTAIVQIGTLMQELEDTAENYWRTKDIDSDAGSLGVLAIQFSTEVLTQSYHKARNFGVVMAISGMVFIAIVGLFMGHVLTRRLNSVVTAARRIANGDYAVSAGVTGRDEIADMGKAFEHMAGEIQKNIAQLAKSEERYRSLIEQASDGIFVTDAKGNYMDVNTSGCRMLGYDKDELLKLNIMGVIPADDLKSDPIQFAELMKGKTIVRERRLKRKDGSLLQVEVSANMLSEDRIMAIVRDITERKQAEEALRSSEEKFSKAFHHSPDAINIVGLKDGRIIEINDGFTSIFGYTSEEVKNKTTVDLQLWANPADRKKVVELLEKDGYVRDFQGQARTKSGKLLDCLFSAANIDLEGDKCLVTTTRDITERKQAEEALRSSEEKFSKAFHSSPDIIGINSIPDGRIIEVNEAFEKITGFRREEVIGKTTVELNVWANPEDRDRYYQEIKQRGKVRNMEVGFRIKNQEVKTALISAEAIKFEGHACLLFIIRDITERKQAERELQKTSGQLRALAAHLQSVREEERTAIAREMHDELGQVLTVLKMDLAMLKKEVNRGPEHKIAANLSNEINAMMTLVDTTIKKVRTLITELRPEVLDTLGLISALEWQAEEFKQRTDINSTFKTDAKEIEFDKDLSIAVFRIVQEALTNVARHSKARQVDIHLTKNNGFLELKIRDDGVGFSKNKLDNDKTFGVLGMKERALILGGEVQIEATEGRGTTVKARIPIR